MKLEIQNKSDRKTVLTPKDLSIKLDGVEISQSLLSLELRLPQGEFNEAVIRFRPRQIEVDAEVLAHLQGVLDGQG